MQVCLRNCQRITVHGPLQLSRGKKQEARNKRRVFSSFYESPLLFSAFGFRVQQEPRYLTQATFHSNLNQEVESAVDHESWTVYKKSIVDRPQPIESNYKLYFQGSGVNRQFGRIKSACFFPLSDLRENIDHALQADHGSHHLNGHPSYFLLALDYL